MLKFRKFSLMLAKRELGPENEGKKSAKRVDHMNRQPKATPIKRLFDMNKIADYSGRKMTRALQTEPGSAKGTPSRTK